MKKYLLLLAVAGLFFTSCQKCKDCEIKVDLTSYYPLTDSTCQATFGMNCEDYLTQGYTASEYCVDELDAIEEAPTFGDDSTYSAYWECK